METRLEVPLHLILDNPYQPRTTDNAEHIKSLALSIAADGLLQVPTVRELNDGTYELAFGHSRRKAFEWLNQNWETEGLPNRYEGYWKMPINVEALSDEDMYRQAVSENVQRRDLDPIELAKSMTVYRDLFEKNSDEIGALFGMNGATVRGLMSFLGLPQGWQDALSKGIITQGVARAALSLQKIAPDEVMTKTLQIIVKRDPSSDETPENIIDDVINDLDHVERMWSESRGDGKPRGDWRNSWLLDMKNFPNKLMEALTYKEVIEALKPYQTPRLEALIQDTSSFFDLLEKLKEANDPEAARIEHLLNPTACTACPYYIKMRGNHFCGMKVCHTRKKAAWALGILQAASRDLNIAIYSVSDGKFMLLTNTDGSLFKKRHKDLRLIMKKDVSGYHYQYGFQGVNDDIFYVVATGAALSKLSVTKSGKGPAVDKTARRKAKIFSTRRKELNWEFTLITKGMFDHLSLTVLETLNKWNYLTVDNRPPDDEPDEDAKKDVRADYLRRSLVWRLVEAQTSWSDKMSQTTLCEIAEGLTELSKEWGVKLPKSFQKMAVQFDEEINSVAIETEA